MKIGLNPNKDIYHIYELEAHSLSVDKIDFFWKNVLQTFGVFIFMTFIVFFMINFRFISSQISDWYGARDYGIATDFSSNLGISDSAVKYLISGIDQDGDGLTDEMEKIIGTDVSMKDSDQDGQDDFKEISIGHNPLGDGKLRTEIKFPEREPLLVTWQDDSNLDKDIAFKKGEQVIIFNSRFIVPLRYIQKSFDDQDIVIYVYFNDKKIVGSYKEKTREIDSNFEEIKEFRTGIQFVSGWPEGTDWQKLIVNLKLVDIKLDN